MQRPRHEPSRRRSGRIGRAWRGLKRAGPGDCTVWGGALALAAFSIGFPWDAYVNQARYGPPTLQFSRNGAVPADVIALREGRAPLFDMVAGTYVGDPPRPGTWPGASRPTRSRPRRLRPRTGTAPTRRPHRRSASIRSPRRACPTAMPPRTSTVCSMPDAGWR